MIKCEINDGRVKLALSGTGIEITAEIMLIVHTVYDAFKKKDEESAEIFKDAIIHNVDACFDSDDERKQRVEESKGNLVRMIRELLSEDDGNDTKHLPN